MVAEGHGACVRTSRSEAELDKRVLLSIGGSLSIGYCRSDVDAAYALTSDYKMTDAALRMRDHATLACSAESAERQAYT
jgi:hypothetical protein